MGGEADHRGANRSHGRRSRSSRRKQITWAAKPTSAIPYKNLGSSCESNDLLFAPLEAIREKWDTRDNDQNN
jgi:hypothetical protein